MKRLLVIVYSLLGCSIGVLHADEIVSIFIRPYPTQQPPQEQAKKAQTFIGKLNHPTTTARSTIKNTLNTYPLAGIMATYAGYLTVSDTNGQIIFPRRHEASSIYVVITPAVTPILMMSNTIHHWEVEIDTPAAFYLIERKVDPETSMAYWETTALETPVNNEIPLDAMIIFDRPKDIYVPLGISLIKQTPNFVLPDIYLKQSQSAAEQALYLLNLRMFFGSIGHTYKKDAKSYAEQIAP